MSKWNPEKTTDKQRELLEAFQSGKFFIYALGGGTNCVDGDTQIFNSLKNKYIKAKDFKTGDSVRSYCYKSKKYIDTHCENPSIKKRADLYEVVTARGFKITCTKNHKFLSNNKWTRLSDLCVSDNLQVYGGIHPLTILEFCQKALFLGVQHCFGIIANSLKNYLKGCRLYGGQLLSAINTVLNVVPLQVCALEHILYACFEKDVSEKKYKHTHFVSRLFFLPSIKGVNFLGSSIAVCDFLFHILCKFFVLLLLIFPLFFLFLLMTIVVLPIFLFVQLILNLIFALLTFSYKSFLIRVRLSYHNLSLREEKIKSIKYKKYDYYYDLHVPVLNSYLGNGFINHNSAKTVGIFLLFDTICKVAPNTRIAVFRKSEKVLKLNSIPSYKKALVITGTKDVNIKDMKAKYSNGSEILFLWADISKDPDCDNVKGGEYTIVFFNEANQVSQKYFEIAKTRVGRWNEFVDKDGKIGKIRPALFLDFNPTKEWPKELFYDKHLDGKLPADTYFQLSLPVDNKFRDKSTDELMKSLPEEEYNRYWLGKWDYDDNPAQLITYEMYRNCKVDEDQIAEMQLTGSGLLSIDPSDDGKDSTAFSYMKQNTIYKYEVDRKLDEIKAAHLAKLRVAEHNIETIIVDSIGVGAGTLKTLEYDGYNVYGFVAGGIPLTGTTSEKGKKAHTKDFYSYKNKRSEAAWLFRLAFQEQSISILHTPEVQKQILAMSYAIDDRVIKLAPKAETRKKLGYSPDLYDSIVMLNYLNMIKDNIVNIRDLEERPNEYLSTSEDMLEKYDF